MVQSKFLTLVLMLSASSSILVGCDDSKSAPTAAAAPQEPAAREDGPRSISNSRELEPEEQVAIASISEFEADNLSAEIIDAILATYEVVYEGEYSYESVIRPTKESLTTLTDLEASAENDPKRRAALSTAALEILRDIDLESLSYQFDEEGLRTGLRSTTEEEAQFIHRLLKLVGSSYRDLKSFESSASTDFYNRKTYDRIGAGFDIIFVSHDINVLRAASLETARLLANFDENGQKLITQEIGWLFSLEAIGQGAARLQIEILVTEKEDLERDSIERSQDSANIWADLLTEAQKRLDALVAESDPAEELRLKDQLKQGRKRYNEYKFEKLSRERKLESINQILDELQP